MSSPEFYMQQALILAEKGRFSVSPNPMVGCVIIKDDKIIGQGFHQQAGEPHAEVIALNNIAGNATPPKKALNADVYITLEPCCHYGKTPPCVNALIKAQVKRVFIACLDPNPLVAGKGVEALNQAGIQTFVGVLEKEAKALNKIFFHYITHKKPYVIIKWAMSLDGKTITHPNDSRIISDEACHQHAHEIRHSVDAILIGAKTALLDNPQLTARNNNVINKKQPWRIILAGSSTELHSDLNIFSPDLPAKTIVVINALVNKKNPAWIKLLKKNYSRIIFWVLPDISALLKKLGENQITSLLIEGGEQTRNIFFHEENRQYINEIQTYISPVFIGDLEKKLPLSALNYKPLGDSLCLVASLKP